MMSRRGARRPTRSAWSLALSLACVLACDSDSRLSSRDTDTPPVDAVWLSISVGMSREAVEHALGEPSETQLLIKRTESIWGPQEDWWNRVAMGDTLRTWSYEIPDEGSFSVYFKGDSDTVSFTAFMPHGVVY